MNDKKKKYLVGTFILIIGIFLLVLMNTEQSAEDFFLKIMKMLRKFYIRRNLKKTDIWYFILIKKVILIVQL